ncbi:MAG: hypothetical protein PHQ44_04875, partial [Anaerovibrio sp.]|nr:hypothetical protein [Anaerovibrio sp.]
VFTWMGDDVQDTLVLMFNKQGHRATNEGIYVSVEAESVNMVQDMLKDILKDKTISAETLAQFVKNKQQEKWDWLLPEALLNKNYASLYLDLESTNSVIKKLL